MSERWKEIQTWVLGHAPTDEAIRDAESCLGYACKRIAELEAALRDLLACRGRSIGEIMDHNDNALNRARAVLKGKDGQGG